MDQATNTTSETDFTPPENRVGDSTGMTGSPIDSTGATTTERSGSSATSPGSTALSPASGTTTNPTTTTASNPATAPATPAPATGTKADNTGVNKRDRDDRSLTPMDQGNSETDRKITQEIRQAVMKDGSLSFSAKNVKIITINGKVTLRGPVKSAEERAAIESAATKVAGAGRVDSQLEIAK